MNVTTERPVTTGPSAVLRRVGISVANTALAAGLLLGAPGTAVAEVALTSELSDCGLLLEGQSSECVRMLQTALNQSNASYGLAEDGEFGPDTRIALLDFQGRNGLDADGNAGPQTLSALAAFSEPDSTGTEEAQGGEGTENAESGDTAPEAEEIPPGKTQIWVDSTPEERKCLDQWLLPDGNGGCRDDPAIGGVEPLGKSGPECAADAVVGAVEDVVDLVKEGTGKMEAVRKIASKRAVPVATIFKCVLWDQ